MVKTMAKGTTERNPIEKIREITQPKNEKRLDEIIKLVGMGEKLRARKEEARTQRNALNDKVQMLRAELAVEDNDKKREKMKAELKEMWEQLENYTIDEELDINGILSRKLLELRRAPITAEAEKEWKEYADLVHGEIDQVKKEAEEKTNELKKLLYNHPHEKAITAGLNIIKK